jgi:hypothetical protein
MHILRVEHPVNDFAAWKRSFDADPAGRRASGVRRYRIARALDDPGFVTVDLEFDRKADAEAFLAKLRGVWGKVTGTLVQSPQGRLLEAVEAKEY